MSEHMFGVTRQKLPAREVKRRDRICREHGGYGYSQIDESHGTAHGGRWIGWFSAPNRGEPFDSAFALDVLSAVGDRCGHSACRQNWIDTGETECVAEPQGGSRCHLCNAPVHYQDSRPEPSCECYSEGGAR